MSNTKLLRLGIEHLTGKAGAISLGRWTGAGVIPVDADTGVRLDGVERCEVITAVDNVTTMVVTCHVYGCSDEANAAIAERKAK